MWSRVVEFMLGCWLAVSPFVFRHAADESAFWIIDFACAAAVMLLALVSWWRPLQHAHVLIAGVGLWLIVFAYLHFGGPIAPGLQNGALVGLLLIMFAVIPNRASMPPPAWESYRPEQHEGTAASGTKPVQRAKDNLQVGVRPPMIPAGRIEGDEP